MRATLKSIPAVVLAALSMQIPDACELQAQTLTATYIELADSADRYMKSEKWDDAERVIIKALRHEPANKSNYILWSNLGMARSYKGDYDGALEAFETGLCLAPSSTILLNGRARIRLVKEQYSDAIADIDKSLSVDPGQQWPLRMKGMALFQTGDDGAAAKALDDYLEKFGDDKSAILLRAELAGRNGDFPTEASMLRRAWEIEPDEDTLWGLLNSAYMMHRLSVYSDQLHDGLKRYPQSGRLYLMRAMLNRANYQLDAMEHDLDTARKLGVAQETIDQYIAKGSKITR